MCLGIAGTTNSLTAGDSSVIIHSVTVLDDPWMCLLCLAVVMTTVVSCLHILALKKTGRNERRKDTVERRMEDWRLQLQAFSRGQA